MIDEQKTIEPRSPETPVQADPPISSPLPLPPPGPLPAGAPDERPFLKFRPVDSVSQAMEIPSRGVVLVIMDACVFIPGAGLRDTGGEFVDVV